MKLALFVLAAIVPFASHASEIPGGNFKIEAPMLTFRYQQFEGTASADCTHALEDAAAQDWRVSCQGEGGFHREYRVHLWVSTYAHPVAPKLSFEILYWVTDLSDPAANHGVGGTTWLHFSEPAQLTELDLSQSVEEDTAGLYLAIRLSGAQ